MATAARALYGGNPSRPATSACTRGPQGHLRLGFPSENNAAAHRPGPAGSPSPVGNLSNVARERVGKKTPVPRLRLASLQAGDPFPRPGGGGKDRTREVLKRSSHHRGKAENRARPNCARARKGHPLSLPTPSQSLKGTRGGPNALARLAEGNVGGGREPVHCEREPAPRAPAALSQAHGRAPRSLPDAGRMRRE